MGGKVKIRPEVRVAERAGIFWPEDEAFGRPSDVVDRIEITDQPFDEEIRLCHW